MPSGGDKFWFETEFGAPEPRPFSACQALFSLSDDATQLTSSGNGNTFHVGVFDTPSVGAPPAARPPRLSVPALGIVSGHAGRWLGYRAL